MSTQYSLSPNVIVLLLLLFVLILSLSCFVYIIICLVNNIDENSLSSLPLSRSTHNPNIIQMPGRLKDFQYHSLEDKDIGHASTLKDSGIDTASSSTILNVLSSDPFKQVY
jgi:hypothetical protein